MSGWAGIGELDNKANSVQLQLQLPTGTELGNTMLLYKSMYKTSGNYIVVMIDAYFL